MRYGFIGLCLLVFSACSNESLDTIDHLRYQADAQLNICRLVERVEMSDDRRKAIYGSLAESMQNSDEQLLDAYLNTTYAYGSQVFRVVRPESLAHCVNTLADMTDDLTDAMEEDRSERNPLFRSRGREVMSGVLDHLIEAERWNAAVRRRNQRR